MVTDMLEGRLFEDPSNYSPPVALKVISSFEEFHNLKSDWNNLLEQTSNDRVFMTHEWFTAWWQAFGEGKSLFIVLAKKGDDIVGIAPLMRFNGNFRGMPVRGIGFMENDDSPGCGFIVKEGHEQIIGNVFSFLIKDIGNWDVLFLKNMPCDEINRIMEFLAGKKKRYITTNGLRSPYLKIDSDWEIFYNGVSTKARKTLKNISNRVKRLGNVTIKEYGIGDKINDMASVSKKAWKYKKGMALINRKDRYRFFQLLSEIAQKNGWLSIWLTYRDDEPIAYEYHLKYKKSDTALLSEFNEDYSNASPGANLDYEIIRALFGIGITEYDMCGSLDDYKRKWTDDIRDYRNIITFNDSLYAKLLYVFEQKIVSPAKKLIRRRKGVY